MDDRSSSGNHGTVVSVRGSVVDIRFEEYLPPIYTLLHAGQEGRIAIEVLSQLDAHLVRGDRADADRRVWRAAWSWKTAAGR